MVRWREYPGLSRWAHISSKREVGEDFITEEGDLMTSAKIFNLVILTKIPFPL